MNNIQNCTAAVSGYVSTVEGQFILANHTKTPMIYVDSKDFPSVVRATKDLCHDITKVTQIAPLLLQENFSKANIIIGTIGESDVMNQLISEGKVDVADITGKWESFKIQLVDQMLVIAGSDQRGTIFGIYDLCSKIGVSPWYWWSDIVPKQATGLYITLEKPYSEYEPTVKYRGIFLNDEYALHNWALHRGDVDYVELYKRIYELMLRLKANFLWPAMHSYSPHFHKNPLNAENAGLYGIVVGSSHCEMLLRNNLCEYFDFEARWVQENPTKRLYKTVLSDSPEPCAYVYVDTDPVTGNTVYNKDLLKAYWRESVELYGRYENLYTMGMRGLHDARWQPTGVTTNEKKAVLLEEIIDAQREILAEVLDVSASKVPQIFIPYKEMQEIYDAGMNVPDDITLMWTDYNYGYIRLLPTDDNRDRAGGAGIYYHLSYHGYPNSYIWLCTTPFALIREEMSKAFDYGAGQVWVANVGDLKPAEKQIEYWLDLARDIHTIRNQDLQDYIEQKAVRDFGFNTVEATEYAEIELKFQELAFARKPEFFGADNFNFEGYGMTKEEFAEAYANKPPFILENLFNYEAFGDEGQQFLNRYQALVERSESLYDKLDEAMKPSFYQLQLYPLKSSYYVVKKYIFAVKSHLYFKQERGTVANHYAGASDDAYFDLVHATKAYNTQSSNKWAQIMDPYQTFFRSCGAVLPKLFETSKATGQTKLGVASEVMSFSGYTKDIRFIDIFNAGYNQIQWSAATDQEYIMMDKSAGTVLQEERIWIGIDWDKLAKGTFSAVITIHHMEEERIVKTVTIPIVVNNDIAELPKRTYAESNGYVAIEAEHYTLAVNGESNEWRIEKNLGRVGDSVKSYPHLARSVDKPNHSNTAYMDYNICFESVGTFEVDIYRIPTLNERGHIRFAVGLNDELPAVLSGNRAYKDYSDGTDPWGKGVLENNELLTTTIIVTQPGIHTLRLYQVDSGVVIDRIVIWTKERIPSYFGPLESYNSTYNKGELQR